MDRLIDFASAAPAASLETTGAAIYSRFETDPDAHVIAVVDPDNRPVGQIERNAFFLKMGAEFGRALFAGRTVGFLMEPPLIERADAPVVDFLAGASSHDPAALLRGFVLVDEDGRYVAVGAALSLLQASQAADKARIEALAKLTTELGAAEQQAQAASRAKSQFLATMSHEIRTPLNGVLAVAEIIERKLEQEELRPYLRTIADSGKTLHRLLTDALDLSRVEAGAMTLDPAPVEVIDVLNEIADLWRSQAELKGLDLRIDGLPDGAVMADAVRLKQVLNNIVGNALKFTEKGGVTLRTSLTTVDDGQSRLEILVEDTGPGIVPDQLQRIFAPFAKADEHASGAGLGLAICQQIISAMGGAMTAASELGKGSTVSFHVILPSVCRIEPCPSPGDAALGDGAAHLLIVDDNETNRLIASTLLGMFGFTHAMATNGREAVERASVEAFDAILMDIKMPVMDGVAATRAIRSGGLNRLTPILAVTANTDPNDLLAYQAAGMVEVVQKPLQAERLLDAIASALEGDLATEALCA